MKTARFASTTIGIGFLLATVLTGNAEEELTLEDYLDVAGIVAWTFEIPDDVRDDEVYEAVWRMPSTRDRETENLPSGLEFSMVPGGRQVKVFLWLEGLWDDFKPTRFCIKFRDSNGKLQKHEGTLQVPEGFTSIYSLMKSGEKTDDGWLMMISNPERERNNNAAFLELDYRSVEE
tara:strand:+ start:3731 stop:4258 length:528 start_codon:yes stop_codon:yes gene_type:complete